MTTGQLIIPATVPGSYWVRFKIVDPADKPIRYLVMGQAKYGWLVTWKGGVSDCMAFVHIDMVEKVER